MGTRENRRPLPPLLLARRDVRFRSPFFFNTFSRMSCTSAALMPSTMLPLPDCASLLLSIRSKRPRCR